MTDFSVRDLPDLTGRRAIVTGATGGIGQATARALAGAGARVVLAVRNRGKGDAVAAAAPGAVEVRELDLSDLESVRKFAAGWRGDVDLLINNAGVSAPTLQRTAQGFEADFGVNHLGHFALTLLLLEHLTGRVVIVSSQAERLAQLDFDDLNWERRPYRKSRAYNDSKLANLLFAAELHRRLAAAGSAVAVHAAHPGLVATGIYHHSGPRRMSDVLNGFVVRTLAQDAEHGALPTLYAAVADLPSGSFAGPSRLAHMRGAPELINRSKAARDPESAGRLWRASERLVSIPARI
ncbi:KR domain-containing protein [Amycolatopsis balhimycina DSM 5908]|uniref:KR domain-containing protein n=1 Tax=Amycolatopsis balhimycina DSM 5908 TaxID=1081091 RepID=A0A428W5J3_AMYBA|nr:oxidoreductase [Amycolatopsis balhimycina]RSM38395.1 KR domain-containing protein [Amycolatopsis balhimycina DSM 5908]